MDCTASMMPFVSARVAGIGGVRFVANQQLQAVGFHRGEVSTAYNKAGASARRGKNAKITTDCTFAVDTDLHSTP